MKKLLLIGVLAPFGQSNSLFASGCGEVQPAEIGSTFPSLNGRLIYESYVQPGDGSGQIWMLDFSTSKLQQLNNSSWGLTDPLNPVFSSDGKWILFYGTQNNAHNIFMYQLGSSVPPINLTNSAGQSRNEDPKFSPDGTHIIFKEEDNSSNFYIEEASLSWANGIPQLGSIQTLVGPTTIELSMPFLSPDSSILYYTKSVDDENGTKYQNIWAQSLNPTSDSYGGSAPNQTFYPIVRSDYAILFAKSENSLFQVVLRLSGANNATVAPFNDGANPTYDPWPVNGTNYVFYSSDAAGPYNLYLGDAKTGQCWSLTGFGVNADTTRGKFGSSYH